MSSTITITVDEKGNSIVGELPPGVFYSRFAAPPDAQIRDVISINAAGLFTLRINAPSVEQPAATAPVELLGSDKFQATFLVDANNLPLLQKYGTAECQVGGFSYMLGVIVNPLNLLIPIAVDLEGEIAVDQADIPIGVHFNSPNHKFGVWGAGDYTFAFSLPSDGGVIFTNVAFVEKPEMIEAEICADGLTVCIYNDYLETNPDVLNATFNMTISSIGSNAGDVVVDPTIINNPINQGGSGGIDCGLEPRYELVGALAE